MRTSKSSRNFFTSSPWAAQQGTQNGSRSTNRTACAGAQDDCPSILTSAAARESGTGGRASEEMAHIEATTCPGGQNRALTNILGQLARLHLDDQVTRSTSHRPAMLICALELRILNLRRVLLKGVWRASLQQTSQACLKSAGSCAWPQHCFLTAFSGLPPKFSSPDIRVN